MGGVVGDGVGEAVGSNVLATTAVGDGRVAGMPVAVAASSLQAKVSQIRMGRSAKAGRAH